MRLPISLPKIGHQPGEKPSHPQPCEQTAEQHPGFLFRADNRNLFILNSWTLDGTSPNVVDKTLSMASEKASLIPKCIRAKEPVPVGSLASGK